MTAILIIDDDRALCRSLQIQLDAKGYDVYFALTAENGLEAIACDVPDLVLLDLQLPDRSGLEVLERILAEHPQMPVAMITGQQDMKSTIEAMRIGAFDYVRKPFELDDVLLIMAKLERLRALEGKKCERIALDESTSSRHEIIGADRRIVEIMKQIGLLSRHPVTVLIEGESGTGKELVARALHEAAADGEPFVAINCSALVPTLLESELFGYQKGAFTGAESTRRGKMEHAQGGTLFLDEIGEVSLDLQAKLLRVLQEREFTPVGSMKTVPFQARVVAATNRSLEKMVDDGEFRKDLFYRLAVARVQVPPLRERKGDIPALVHHLAARISRSLGRSINAIEERAMDRLSSFPWPGNVRELENVLTRSIALGQGDILSLQELDAAVVVTKNVDPPSEGDQEIVPLHVMQKTHIARALAANQWNIAATARILAVSQTTLRKKIVDFQLRKGSSAESN